MVEVHKGHLQTAVILYILFLFPLWEKSISLTFAFTDGGGAFHVPHTHTQKDEVSSFLIKSYYWERIKQCRGTNVWLLKRQ